MITEIKEIKKYAIDNEVPIMTDEGIDFLTNFIVDRNINKVLEIGTAIGYSSIMMALTNPNLVITTVERDEERYLEALKNVKKLGLEKRINLIFNDALDVEIKDKDYDLVFIDAAKGQNIKFFEKFTNNLKKGGYVITDNIYFHGLVDNPEQIESRNLRQLVKKIKAYIEYLENNDDYDTEILRLGDGISISYKK